LYKSQDLPQLLLKPSNSILVLVLFVFRLQLSRKAPSSHIFTNLNGEMPTNETPIRRGRRGHYTNTCAFKIPQKLRGVGRDSPQPKWDPAPPPTWTRLWWLVTLHSLAGNFVRRSHRPGYAHCHASARPADAHRFLLLDGLGFFTALSGTRPAVHGFDCTKVCRVNSRKGDSAWMPNSAAVRCWAARLVIFGLCCRRGTATIDHKSGRQITGAFHQMGGVWEVLDG